MRTAIIALRNDRLTSGQHPSLLLQRYLCENATGDHGNPAEKRAILDAAINAAANHDVQKLYEHAFQRWKKTLKKDDRITQSVELATAGRLIVGLGSENVLETGITLHHTYGMPTIPGSALKGLAAHYCDQVWGAENNSFRKPGKNDDEAYCNYLAGNGEKPDENFHRLLFGNSDDSGCLVFHDAWYAPEPSSRPLCLDVMTPHHPKRLDGSVPPTDFDSPTPVPFLSVTGRFCIAVSWCGPDVAQAERWVTLAITLLTQALDNRGIGGKTSSGYGRLVDPDSLPKQPSPAAQNKQKQTFARGDKITIEPTGKTTKSKGNKPGKPLFRIVGTDQPGFFQEGQTPPAISEGETAEAWIANTGDNFTFSVSEVKTKRKRPSQQGQRRR